MPGLPPVGATDMDETELDLDYADEGRRQFYGFCLDKDTKEFTWLARTYQNKEIELDDNFIQSFVITNAVLGATCEGRHIVEVETENVNNKKMKLQIINLDPANSQRHMNITVTKDSTFRLIAGDGPLTITGVQVPEMVRSYGMEMSQDESDEEEEELDDGVEETKAQKRPLSATAKGTKLKKAKMSSTSGEEEDMEEDDELDEDEEEEEEEDEEDEESPPKKTIKKKGAKKGGRGSGIGADKIKEAKKAAAAKVAKGKGIKAKK